MSANSKDPVFHAIRRAFQSHQLDLSRDQQRRAELKAQLAGVEEGIESARTAIEKLAAFAHEQGWSTRELSR